MPNIWQQALSLIEKKLNKESFDTWFMPTSFLNYDGGSSLEVAVPNELFSNWLRENYNSLINDTLKALALKDVSVNFVISTSEKIEELNKKQTAKTKAAAAANFPAPRLNPRYTFENFVIGGCNQFAHAASLAVAEKPSRSYNPFYIYGGVGLGKTHLLHAIGHRILREKPSSKIIYVCAEEFMNELVNAIRFDRTAEFRLKYRQMDVLLIDDIQFIAGKERTQEEFFHTFNTLHESHKQIVITSDCPPKEIPTIEERLRSRFEWGLIADIQSPDLETKLAILKKKVAKENIEVPDSVCFLIASSSISNIRELEGSLNRISAYSAIHGEEISVNLAQKVLKDILIEKEKSINIDRIQDIVANYYGLKINELKAKNRAANIAFPRQVAMYLCKNLTKLSLPQIGKSFGGKDHTTVLHACNKIANQMESDSRLKSQINYLIDNIKRA